MTGIETTPYIWDLPLAGGPFAMGETDAYRRWRDRKLEGYPAGPQDLIVEIGDPRALTTGERGRIQALCRKANLALYVLRGGRRADKDDIRALGRQLGLERLDDNLCADEDGITSLRVMPAGRHAGYIPYSDRPLNWHTDGYYNPPQRRIRAIVMHCVSSASSGGENGLLDHEMAYLLMRERDPSMVEALMAPDAMAIPPNEEAGEQIRPRESGPVFSVDPVDGALHMRYTARARNVAWREDAATRAAREFLQGLFAGSPYLFRHRLEPGQGVICNNVLHSRSGFSDAPGAERLHYRARYYDRVAGTGLDGAFARGVA